MKTFVKFAEDSEWEGETWVFWLQSDGNQAALLALQEALAVDDDGDESDDGSSDFTLELDAVLVEHDVDVLVQHGGSGYLSYHNKVTGTMKTFEGNDFEGLYKGGIRDLFKADE